MLLSKFEKPSVPATPAFIGNIAVDFSDPECLARDFLKVYNKMPKINNVYGMKSPHLFLLWNALKQLHPDFVIESGVYKGLGTWWIEQACPTAKIYCIDVDYSNIEYKSLKATYLNDDFACHRWDSIDKNNTVIFFDDHQNALTRLMQMKWMGFSKAIFDDNYASYTGDCYSCKKMLAGTGNQWGWDKVPENSVDGYFLQKNVKIYQEFPAPFRCDNNRFGYPWTEEALFIEAMDDAQRLLQKEADSYTYMCYVEMKVL